MSPSTLAEFKAARPVTKSDLSSSSILRQEPPAASQATSGRSFARKLAVAAALAAAGYGVFAVASGSNGPDASHSSAANASIPVRSVKIAVPAQASSADVVLPATLQPWQVTTLHARVSGYLTAWHRELGSHVKAGELLAELETPELDQELAEGQSLASESQAAVVQARAERAEAESELHVAEAQLARAEAQTELSRTQLVRREKLLAHRAVSQEDYDTFKTEVDARSADVAAAQADVARRRTSLETRAAVISAREATARSRQANVDRLKELQAFKRIVAPFDGVVTSRKAELGMLVTAGKEALFVVEDMNRIRVQMNVPQSYSDQIRPGTLATVSLPESSQPPVEGRVTRVAGSVEPASRTMLAEIELENRDRNFQPGSYARVTAATSGNGNASWTIPANTLSMRIDGPHVAIVDDQDRIELRPVRLGRDLGSRVVVLEGIRGHERLVVNPTDDLATGQTVRTSAGAPEIVAR